MLRILLLVLGLALLALGGEGLYHVARNREQATLTCEALAQQITNARWLRLTGCDVDYAHASVRDPGGRIQELYFPVRPAGQSLATPAPLVVATRDTAALAIAQATIGDNQLPDQEAITVMWLKIVTALNVSREVEGYVRTGLIDRLRTERDLSGISGLTAPYVALDLHARPSPVLPGIWVGAGLVALFGFVALGLRRRRAAAAPAAVDAPEAEAPAAPAAAVLSELESFAAEAPAVPVRVLPDPLQSFDQQAILEPVLPAMMMLNLQEEAGPDAIEHAPPLGSHTDVMGSLARACGGIGFDERGRGVFDGTGFSMVLEIGAPDQSPVWTITVRARGPAAMEAVQGLASRTGWRVFVPRQGHFLPADREKILQS